MAAGRLNGGGRDVLLGGSNCDLLVDGDRSGQADADVLDGRVGGGTVSYASRAAPVRVDLSDAEPDGEAGEGDVLRSIRGAVGGARNDVLRGSDEGGPLTAAAATTGSTAATAASSSRAAAALSACSAAAAPTR